MAGYWMPYVPRRRRESSNALTQLMLLQGQQQAEAAREQGRIWAEGIRGAGASFGQALDQFLAERKASKREEALSRRDAALSAWVDSGEWAKDPQEAVAGSVRILGPREGPRFAEGLLGAMKMGGARDPQEAMRALPMMARGLRAAPEALRPGLYMNAREMIVKAGVFQPDQLPEQWSPDLLPFIEEIAGVDQGKKDQGFTLSPGQVRYGPDGKPIATAPGAEPKGPAVGTFEDFVIQQYGPRPTPDQIIAARKAYQRADDRPQGPPVQRFAPKMVTVAGQEVMANYDAITGKYHDPETGEVLSGIKSAPTADMRNKAAGRKLVEKSVTAIKNLSQKVITKRGVAQRAMAAGRSVDAVLGNDPEYRTYQDARVALAGNLAVAQQGSRPSDADIKSVWLPLVPDVFRDTDESAAMKWQLVETMSNIDSPQGGLGDPGASGGSGTADDPYVFE